MRNLLLRIWSLRKEFFRYFIIGLSGFVLDIGSLYILKEYGRWDATLAVVVNQLFILNYIFVLNKYWSFKAVGITRKQILRFYILSVVNYLVAVGWMACFNSLLGFDYLFARILNIICSVSWNFLLYKYWVYKREANCKG